MDRRKIAVLTGTRADYGLLFWILRETLALPDLELQLLVTGAHLSTSHGATVNQIESDGLPISARIDMAIDGDRPKDIVAAMARGLAGMGEALSRLRPGILVLLGDRYELLPAAYAALILGIPIAHIHGGELSEGVFDEQIRHALTKLSHLHFPVAEEYRHRILQMGEDPTRVFVCGAPGLDHLARTPVVERRPALARVGIVDNGQPFGLLTYHPVTLAPEYGVPELEEILDAIHRFPELTWIASFPNADPGNEAISVGIRRIEGGRDITGVTYTSVSSEDYLSLLRNTEVLVGNSSSGIIEAPSFGTPVVNVGPRQSGRVRARNVLDVEDVNAEAIAAAIRTALSPEFRKRAQAAENPFFQPDASARIVEVLRTVELGPSLLRKAFCDLPAFEETWICTRAR